MPRLQKWRTSQAPYFPALCAQMRLLINRISQRKSIKLNPL